jgi:hypothetical protein
VKTVALKSTGNSEDMNYTNDLYSDDGEGSEFNSDSNGMKRGG